MTTKTYGLDLTGHVLRDEIELVADLVVAAAGCSGRMSESQIDEALGLRGRLRHGAGAHPSPACPTRCSLSVHHGRTCSSGSPKASVTLLQLEVLRTAQALGAHEHPAHPEVGQRGIPARVVVRQPGMVAPAEGGGGRAPAESLDG